MDNFHNDEWSRRYIYKSMDEFLNLSRRFSKFGLTQKDIEEAVKSSCDFFGIPMPRMIKDLTNVQNGQTMFMNWNPGSYYDDVLCFNMEQLIQLKVDSKEAFSLVMTHENAHRVLQQFRLPGINNGIWEKELAADYLMGCRAGLWNMDVSKIGLGLYLTSGSPTHPEGALRTMFINHGKNKAVEMHRNGIPLTIQNLMNEFLAYRQMNLEQILHFQRKFYRF